MFRRNHVVLQQQINSSAKSIPKVIRLYHRSLISEEKYPDFLVRKLLSVYWELFEFVPSELLRPHPWTVLNTRLRDFPKKQLEALKLPNQESFGYMLLKPAKLFSTYNWLLPDLQQWLTRVIEPSWLGNLFWHHGIIWTFSIKLLLNDSERFIVL